MEDSFKKGTPNLRKVAGQEKQQSCKGSEVRKSLVCEKNWKEARVPEARRVKGKWKVTRLDNLAEARLGRACGPQ